MKSICLISGGMDSSVLLHTVAKEYKHDVYALSFNYGQRHCKELLCALRQSEAAGVKDHKIVNLDFVHQLVTNSALTNESIDIPRMKDVMGDPQLVTYVNCRNLLFLTIAASYAECVGATEIYYGAVEVDEHSYWDCSQLFLQKVNEILSLNRKHTITVKAPLVALPKAEIIAKGKELGVNFADTRTCYSDTDFACGVCPSCAARLKGFVDAKMIDPLKYTIEIPWNKLI